MVNIKIVVKGGMVVSVLTDKNTADVDVEIIDMDVEGNENWEAPEDLIEVA